LRANFHRYAAFRFAVILLTALVAACFAAGSCEALFDAEMAVRLAEKLGAEFKPESLFVRVSGSRGFFEARGVYLSGVRIDRLSMEAVLTASELPEGEDIHSLASLIGYSWGEIELLASDINAYFAVNETRGFSNLAVRFSPEGFSVSGIFTQSLLFTFRIRLSATGKFGLRPDGVYIENPEIYIERVRQPGFLVNEIMERANPLIEWSNIPFSVTFKEISMTEHSAIMTGGPRNFEGGALATWSASEGGVLLN